MIVRLFQPRFAPLVKSGAKRCTIRATSKRLPRVGEVISLRQWSGKPYRSKQVVLWESMVSCVKCVEIRSNQERLFVERVELDAADADSLAQSDGFQDRGDLFGWFNAMHETPFHGVLIAWEYPDRTACRRCGKTFQPALIACLKDWRRCCGECEFRNLSDALGMPTPPEMLDRFSLRPTLSDDEYRRELAKPIDEENL